MVRQTPSESAPTVAGMKHCVGALERKRPSVRVAALMVGAALFAIAAGPGGATASRLVTSADIKNGTILSRDVQDGGLRVTDLNRRAREHFGGPTTGETVTWTVSTPSVPQVDDGNWGHVLAPVSRPLPPNSRVTTIDIEVDGDLSRCTRSFFVIFQTRGPDPSLPGYQYDLGTAGIGGAQSTIVGPYTRGEVAALAVDSPTHIWAATGCSNADGRTDNIPAFTATITLLVEHLPAKPDRTL